eukprot:CAMPEP_0172890384 /NCGR_PEP_ID=MMETSP1075-20121228/141122_1 /TAXON_ID=2916 /ORGANISM="Ceratium fusus, Strain PA161109" /LENGTH=161 /DNA_ID=CAMNT_0013744629 /DNA_START=121 /DNA_END=606 /DNA_ORIENTATION=+
MFCGKAPKESGDKPVICGCNLPLICQRHSLSKAMNSCPHVFRATTEQRFDAHRTALWRSDHFSSNGFCKFEQGCCASNGQDLRKEQLVYTNLRHSITKASRESKAESGPVLTCLRSVIPLQRGPARLRWLQTSLFKLITTGSCQSKNQGLTITAQCSRSSK